jgi:hypothetical protein
MTLRISMELKDGVILQQFHAGAILALGNKSGW